MAKTKKKKGPPVMDPEFAAIFPKLSKEETKRLRAKLSKEGCTSSLYVWAEENILLDGYNRLPLFHELKIRYTVKYLSFKSRELAKNWVVDNQLARRNLTDEQRTYFMGVDFLRAQAKKLDQIDPPAKGEPTSAEDIGKKHGGASKATVHRAARFAKGVDALPPEEQQKVLAGKSEKTKAEIAAGAPVVDWRAQKPQDTFVGTDAVWEALAEAEIVTMGQLETALNAGRTFGLNDQVIKQLFRELENQQRMHDPRKKKDPDNGRPIFDWPLWEKGIGYMVRGMTLFLTAHGQANGDDHDCWKGKMDELITETRSIYEKYAKQPAPKS